MKTVFIVKDRVTGKSLMIADSRKKAQEYIDSYPEAVSKRLRIEVHVLP